MVRPGVCNWAGSSSVTLNIGSVAARRFQCIVDLWAPLIIHEAAEALSAHKSISRTGNRGCRMLARGVVPKSLSSYFAASGILKPFRAMCVEDTATVSDRT